jgi:hypothetical protein
MSTLGNSFYVMRVFLAKVACIFAPLAVIMEYFIFFGRDSTISWSVEPKILHLHILSYFYQSFDIAKPVNHQRQNN